MTSYSALIFDLDGTLVDSAPGICDSARAACARLGYAEPGDEVVRPLIGLPLVLVARAAMAVAVDDAAIELWCATYRMAFDEIALPDTRAFPAVPEELMRWRAAGRRLAVATSKRTDVALSVLRQAGLLDVFEVVVGGEQVDRGKPAPDMALRALELLGEETAVAAVIGDTAHDVGMARAADVAVYAVTYGAHDRATLAAAGPHAIVDSFVELRRYLG